MDTQAWLILVAVVSTGLSTGLLFGWAVSVMPGTARVADTEYIAVMQSINRAIINPFFLVPFLLSPVLLVIASVGQFGVQEDENGWLLGTAAVVYAVGVLAVTIAGNIPLNDRLEAFDLDAADTDAASVERTTYERGWNRWHYVRTLASLSAFVLAVASAL